MVFKLGFEQVQAADVIQRTLERDRLAWHRRVAKAALRQCYDRLTPREQEVMRLVVSGLLNKQIVAALGTIARFRLSLSPPTAMTRHGRRRCAPGRYCRVVDLI